MGNSHYSAADSAGIATPGSPALAYAPRRLVLFLLDPHFLSVLSHLFLSLSLVSLFLLFLSFPFPPFLLLLFPFFVFPPFLFFLSPLFPFVPFSPFLSVPLPFEFLFVPLVLS